MTKYVILVFYVGSQSESFQRTFSRAREHPIVSDWKEHLHIEWKDAMSDNLIGQITTFKPDILICDFDDSRVGGLDFINQIQEIPCRPTILGGGQAIRNWVPYEKPLPDLIYHEPNVPDRKTLERMVAQLIKALLTTPSPKVLVHETQCCE